MKRTINFLLFGLAFGCLISCFTPGAGVADGHEQHPGAEELEHRIADVEAALDRAVEGRKAAEAEVLRKEYERLLEFAEQLEREHEGDERERDEDDERHEDEDDERHEDDEHERDDDDDERHAHEHHDDDDERHEGDWDEDEEEEEHLDRHVHKVEMHMMELELEKRRIEIEVMRQEVATRTARFAADREASTAYAVQALVDSSEHPEQAIDALSRMLRTVSDPVGKRIVSLHLARLFQATGRLEEAREVLTSMVAGPRGERREPRRGDIDGGRRRPERDTDNERDGRRPDRDAEDRRESARDRDAGGRREDVRRNPERDRNAMIERRAKQA